MPHEKTIATSGSAMTDVLPSWELTALYPGLDSAEFSEGFAALLGAFDSLERLFDELGIGESSGQDATPLVAFERALTALNEVEAARESMEAYLYGFVTTDSRNAPAQARLSELQERSVALRKMGTRFVAWLGGLPVQDFVQSSPLAESHAFALLKMQEEARHLMTGAEEDLAAELAPSGAEAWSKLHGTLTSQIIVPVEIDDRTELLTMSQVRNLALSPRREVRDKAFIAELDAWRRHEAPLAAALNGVKGQSLVLASRRRWDDPLSEALFGSNMEREVLEAMIAVAREALPDFRRYLRLKARVLGIASLAWYDLFAPVGESRREWDWSGAARFIEEQFATFSPRLEELARRAFREQWIDAPPRPGKVGGAFCMWLKDGESRILANFSPGYDAVSTLAHELGHAYHNLNEAGLTPLQRRTPMTLAETASTFCETIVKEAALNDADERERLYILEQSLQGACQIVVDILSRFDFERSLFAARRERELSPGELCGLMMDAQRGTYGDGLDGETLHPYMWAVKGHYYRTGESYYNFPYLFGLLFGFGLFAHYRRDPDGFPERYDALLASTGQASAAELAARFDIDLRAPDFWRGGLDVVRRDIDRFATLVES